ncbi:hypothetical protein [Brevifollis gellanilyticus]|uniref:Uncharacterized protein n=1 Tax=Brevifollis gellanilyticus TaxID=748831 RepID=A0A512M555_9BACT|nr:hypothetical protein [Brevifollis gellanilyticus]GEP41859.1 hypothetical protein BGE01nite_11500 [Brevifollis gellanilyticus]
MSSSRQPYHDPSGDEMEHAYFCYLADKFEKQPELLDVALETIDRWVNHGHWAKPKLDEWRQVILSAQSTRQGFLTLTSLLRRDDEEAREFRGYDPFPAVLDEQEKQSFSWISRH